MPRRTLATLVLTGCSWLFDGPVCVGDDPVLAPAVAVAGQEPAPPLTCAQAQVAIRYVTVLAGRPMQRAERTLLLRDLRDAYRADPSGVRSDLDTMDATLAELRAVVGLEAARARSRRAWADLTTRGPFDRYPQGKRALAATVAVWASDDDRELVLTEADIEGWISYASLGREVQQGGPLKLSVANREGLYRELRARFRAGDEAEQIALVAIGPFWRGITARWQAASYEQQQGWAGAAPLPPPMTSSSLPYAEAVFEQPFPLAAAVLHEHLGPLRLDGLSD